MRTRKSHDERVNEVYRKWTEAKNARDARINRGAQALKAYQRWKRLIGKLEERIEEWEAVLGDLEYRIQVPDVEPTEADEIREEMRMAQTVLTELYTLQEVMDE